MKRLSPGSPLTAGTAAELVIDTAGLVALRAQHEEAARRNDLFRVLADTGGILLKQRLILLARLEDRRVLRFGIADGLRDDLRGDSPFSQAPPWPRSPRCRRA